MPCTRFLRHSLVIGIAQCLLISSSLAGSPEVRRLVTWGGEIRDIEIVGNVAYVAKGVLLCIAITLFAVAMLPHPQKQSILTSRSGYYIGILLDRAHAVMPEEIHDVLHPYIHKIEEHLDPESPANQPGARAADEPSGDPERTAAT